MEAIIRDLFNIMPNRPTLNFVNIYRDPFLEESYECDREEECPGHPENPQKFLLSIFFNENNNERRLDYDLWSNGRLKAHNWSYWALNHALQDWCQDNFRV